MTSFHKLCLAVATLSTLLINFTFADSQFAGTYEFDGDPSDAAYVGYLTSLGYNDQIIGVMKQSRPKLDVIVNGPVITYKATSKARVLETKFESGVEFEEKLVDGRSAKTTITAKDNTFVKVMKVGDLVVSNTYTFSKDGITVELKCHDKTAIQKYKRV